MIILSCFWAAFPLVASAEPAPFDVTAKEAVVIEATTGRVLFAKNAERRAYPASTTKILTLIVALERGNLEATARVSENAAATEGSSIGLVPGEKMRLLDLLYGMMLMSGNDAAVTIAENIAGSVPAFAAMMNEKAREIGAKDTHFTNPDGLPDENHYTTARDLAVIAAYGYRLPLFAKIVATEHQTIPGYGAQGPRELYNENRLLWLYDGANGVKTGYTDIAGRCLVSGAKRKNVQLVAVVLDSEHMWDDSVALLDFGFARIRPVTLLKGQEAVKTLKVAKGRAAAVRLAPVEDVVIPMVPGDESRFQTRIDAPDSIQAPVAEGQRIGALRVLFDGRVVKSIDLVALSGSERMSFLETVTMSLRTFFAGFLRGISDWIPA